MAAPGRTSSSIEVVYQETTMVRPEPPPPPPPPAMGVSSSIEITTMDPMGGATVVTMGCPSMGCPNMNVRASMSNQGANMQVTSNDMGMMGQPQVAQPRRSVSSTRFERRTIIEGGNETVEEYENGRLVRKMLNGKEQPLR
ncbi:uncharacterized protein LOC135397643 [Ornithodoros turicata]|uniref:uncharacterized protein LOC135397643 n=1 Tax=Ornithodoros turicata TaxID=34597 RepID=UPI00313A421A